VSSYGCQQGQAASPVYFVKKKKRTKVLKTEDEETG
jgi:hypothetical protein